MANRKAKNCRTHIAIAFCEACRDLIVSPGGGRFRTCSCGKSSIDQERWDAQWVRIIGDQCTFIEQICSKDCKIKSHRKKDEKKVHN